MRTLKDIDPEFPLQYSICLAEIALNEGLSLTALAENTEMNLSTVSRIVASLSAPTAPAWPKSNKSNKKGYGLVYVTIVAEERRKKQLWLTDKGHLLINKIARVL